MYFLLFVQHEEKTLLKRLNEPKVTLLLQNGCDVKEANKLHPLKWNNTNLETKPYPTNIYNIHHILCLSFQ